ncbi:uncharacterized protein LOC103095854 isoform X1 [Monodelphis domestica]|uniref:uncharacterized protein LOC103095854 isoform X1 n=1 Tax=Monodelphis domestica TaxID=13616 RepID=UPI00044337F8|nr:uncharacterized protein LOC103095854 isoform X1 [Monodelphis domestica]
MEDVGKTLGSGINSSEAPPAAVSSAQTPANNPRTPPAVPLVLGPPRLQDLQFECGQCINCLQSLEQRRNSRCWRWINECTTAFSVQQEQDQEETQEGDEDEDGDGEGEGEGEGDGDGNRNGDCALCLILAPNSPRHSVTGSSSQSSECPPSERQGWAPDFQWPNPLELALDVSALLALLSFLRADDSGMLLLFAAWLFILYLLVTIPLVLMLGSRRRSRRRRAPRRY